MHLFCNREPIDRSRSSKVDISLCHPKARMRLPISPSWSYLAPFPRYGHSLTENCLFFLPLSHLVPSLPMFPLEFHGTVNHEETRVMGLSSSEDHNYDYSKSHIDIVPACDGRMDIQTDRRTHCKNGPFTFRRNAFGETDECVTLIAHLIIIIMGHRLSSVTGDSRETMYLFQRVFLAVQRYNSVAFKGTFLVPTELD